MPHFLSLLYTVTVPWTSLSRGLLTALVSWGCHDTEPQTGAYTAEVSPVLAAGVRDPGVGEAAFPLKARGKDLIHASRGLRADRPWRSLSHRRATPVCAFMFTGRPSRVPVQVYPLYKNTRRAGSGLALIISSYPGHFCEDSVSK